MRIIEGKEAILGQCSDLLSDESKMSGGSPSMVAFPENADDLKLIILTAAKNKQKITFIGGHTGTTGGAIPVDNCIAVSFSRMNHIKEVTLDHTGNPILICEPGITLNALSDFLKDPAQWQYSVPGSELLKGKVYCYLPDPTEMSAQLGGTVATNASGARSFRFGPTRTHIYSLSLLLATGDTFSVKRGRQFDTRKEFTITTNQNASIIVPPFFFESPELKNASGFYSKSKMDLIDLFIGSEGTLAAFTSIGIRLHEQMDFIAGCTFFSSREYAFAFADFLRTDLQVSAIEFFDQSSLHFIDKYRERFPEAIPEFPDDSSQAILWEFIDNQPDPFESRYESWEDILQKYGTSFDKTWSGIEPEEINRLKKLRHALPEMVNTTICSYKLHCDQIRKIGTDTALPKNRFTDVYNKYLQLITSKQLIHAAFGHLGDYHIHINILPSNAQELQTALDVYDSMMSLTINNNGTISAEHGIGKLKKKYLLDMYGIETVEKMKRIKRTFDPDWLFNPETLFYSK